MSDIVSGGKTSSGGGSGIPVPASFGLVGWYRGHPYTVELRYAWPVFIENGDGVRGDPTFQVRTSIGEARDIDLSTIGDKPIQIGPYAYRLKMLTLGLAQEDLSGVVASIYTGANGTGELIGTITGAQFGTLTERMKLLEIPFAAPVVRMDDWLYIRVTAAAAAAKAKVSAWVDGQTLIANDFRGMPR
jgi:hypothetical protein